METRTNLIAFSGPINSGKSTATNMMQYCLNAPAVFRHYCFYKVIGMMGGLWQQTSFAAPLKKTLATILNVDVEKFEDRSFKENCYVAMDTLEHNIVPSPEFKLNDNQFNKAIKNDDVDRLAHSHLTIRQLMQ